MAAMYFVTVCKELKIAQIVQINQQFLNLICANGDAFVNSYANEHKCKQWRQQIRLFQL